MIFIKIFRLHIIVTIFSVFSACTNFLEVGPPVNQTTADKVFDNDQLATSTVTGIYSRMAGSASPFSGSQSSISILTGLSADEFLCYNTELDEFYRNDIQISNANISNMWRQVYQFIYTANAVLEGLESSSKVTDATSKQLQGESKFIRAFCYFYLINLYDNIPLSTTTDFRKNQNLRQASKTQVYQLIISDLTDAKNLLSSTYITDERVRPNRFAAAGLLARVYLYAANWSLAIENANEVIAQNAVYGLNEDLDRVFLKNSSEAIWQLMPTAGSNSQEGATLRLESTPTIVSIPAAFVNLFEEGDNRGMKWIGEYIDPTGTYYYPNKYKIRSSSTVTEYSTIIRLAEIFLIRAEARAKLNMTESALEDINRIRNRAGLTTRLFGFSSERCLEEVERQRRFELFSEWGHRWLDLKRTNRSNAVLAPAKGTFWNESHTAYPIPSIEISRNSHMIQNQGY